MHVLKPLSILCETNAVLKTPCPATLRSMGDTDFVCLIKEDMEVVLQHTGELRSAIVQLMREADQSAMDAADEDDGLVSGSVTQRREMSFVPGLMKKMSSMGASRQRRQLLRRVPIIGALLDEGEVSALALLLQLATFTPLSVVISRTEMCEKLLILLDGRVTFAAKGGVWGVGEAAGYTCIVDHRWHRTALAATNVTMLSIDKAILEAFLADCGKLQHAKNLVGALLTPDRCDAEQMELALRAKGLEITPSVKAMCSRTGQMQRKLPPLPATMRTTFAREVESLRQEVALMSTPITYPVMTGTQRHTNAEGFVPRVKAEHQFGVDLHVTPGLFVPTLSTDEKRQLLAKVTESVERRGHRQRMTHVTPFLLVKH